MISPSDKCLVGLIRSDQRLPGGWIVLASFASGNVVHAARHYARRPVPCRPNATGR
jgi:hypothetical protein